MKRNEQFPNPELERVRSVSRKTIFVLVMILAGLLMQCGSDAPPSEQSKNAPAIDTAVKSTQIDSERLVGRWQRTDGSYVIEIRSTNADGTMDASYLNPKQINVSRAEWQQDGSLLRVFVELDDVNYPGSTYTLHYSPEKDAMTGEYFQAVYKQT